MAWRVRGEKAVGPHDGSTVELYVVGTDSSAVAMNAAARSGINCRTIDAVTEDQIPTDAWVVQCRKPAKNSRDHLRSIAESPLVKRPVMTIAMGLVVGWFFVLCISIVIALLAAMFGFEVTPRW